MDSYSKEYDKKKSFFCESKASISCVWTRWLCFYSPFTKRMEIVMRIHVRQLYGINFDFRENDGKKSFSCETKVSISCIIMRWMYFYSPITKRMEAFIKIHLCHIYRWNLILWKMMERRILVHLICGMKSDSKKMMEIKLFV